MAKKVAWGTKLKASDIQLKSLLNYGKWSIILMPTNALFCLSFSPFIFDLVCDWLFVWDHRMTEEEMLIEIERRGKKQMNILFLKWLSCYWFPPWSIIDCRVMDCIKMGGSNMYDILWRLHVWFWSSFCYLQEATIVFIMHFRLSKECVQMLETHKFLKWCLIVDEWSRKITEKELVYENEILMSNSVCCI